MNSRLAPFIFLSAVALFGSGSFCAARAQAPREAAVARGDDDAKKGGGKDAATKPAEAAKPGDDKSFDDAVKDLEVVKGLFTLYRKPDENKTLMEIAPDQLGKVFLFAWSVDQSAGERGLYGAQQGTDFAFTFERVGKTIDLYYVP